MSDDDFLACPRTVSWAVERSLAGVTDPAAAGAAALARRYAADIDGAALAGASVARALRELRLQGCAPELCDRLEVLAVRVEETAVLAALGPKLLAALELLGLAGAARAEPGGDNDGSGRPAAVERLRDRARKRRAAAVDPAAS